MVDALGREVKALKPMGATSVCTSLDTTLFKLTVLKYIYPSVSKVHAGSFRVSVINRTPDMDYRIFSVRSAYLIILMRACVYTQGGGLVTPTVSQHNIFAPE